MNEQPENHSFWDLVRTRNFGLLWGAGGLSAIGDQFDLIAFPWLVLLVAEDPVAVGIVLALGNFPAIFFMLIGGSLVDRYSPRVVMLASNGIRIVLVGTLAVLVLTDLIDLWLIYVFALLKRVADSSHYPAQMAMLPRIVPVMLLRQAYAAVHTTTQLSGFVGPALAGCLIAFFSGAVSSAGSMDSTGLGLAFSVVAITLMIASAMLLMIRMVGSSSVLAGEDERAQHAFLHWSGDSACSRGWCDACDLPAHCGDGTSHSGTG
jgi:MFS family permease